MVTASSTQAAAPRRPLTIYLMATAFVCGALIMVIEVLGSRVIGPFFGVSLFVWTSLISVALLSLAGGYAVGGVLADRWRSADHLYAIIFLAGVSVLLIPHLKAPVLQLCLPLGLRAGSFVSALLLFGPALLLLGCVSPYLVRIAAQELGRLGRTVGGLYALSTLGSVCGTVVTGFFLIAYFGLSQIFHLLGALLIALALIYLVCFRNAKYWPALGLAALPLMALTQSPLLVDAVLENGTRAATVARRDSFYGSLQVVDYSYGERRTRELIIDGLIQGGVDLNNGLSVYAYTYYLTLIPYALHPEGRHCLVLGLGPGLIPRWYEARGVRTDVLDIDPEVVELARRYFGFRNSGETIVADARYFLAQPGRRYDYLILDVFTGDTTPTHLLSVEALSLFQTRMNPHAVLAINLVGSLRLKPFMTASVVNTLRQLFDQVELYPTFAPDQGEGFGNLAVIAYDGPPRQLRGSRLNASELHPLVRRQLIGNLGARFRFPPDTPAIVLNDDYNPIDVYDAWLKETVRRDILATTDQDILSRTD